MAFLDFVKNREGQRPAAEQQSQQQKAENYKEFKTRESVQDKAALKPLDSLPDQPRSELNEVKARMEKATQYVNQGAPAPTQTPTEATASPEPQMQKMANQDKAAPKLSPTSMQAGSTSSEKESTTVKADQPKQESAKPERTLNPTPTPSPRGRGGWER